MATESFSCTSCNLTFISCRALSIHRFRSSAHNDVVEEAPRRGWSRTKKRTQVEAFDEAEAVTDPVQTAEAQESVESEALSAQDEFVSEGSAAAAEASGYDEALLKLSAEMGSDRYGRTQTHTHTPLSACVEEGPLSGLLNPFPSWEPWDQAAYALALTGPVQPVDLVSGGQLTKEESQLTARR